MKRPIFAFLCTVLLAAAVRAQESTEPLACDVKSKCNTLSSLEISFMGVGNCTGTSRANCTALAEAEPCIDEVIQRIDQGVCTPDTITFAARCFAVAIAEIFAEAYVAIECTGEGQGCGFAMANGEAWACTFAAALVDLEVNAGADQQLCDLSIGPMAAAFASVATSVQVEVCADGNEFKEGFQQEFGLRIEELVAEAIAGCLVNCTTEGPASEGTVEGGAALEPPTIDGNLDVNTGGETTLPCNIFQDPNCREQLEETDSSPATASAVNGTDSTDASAGP